MGVRQLLRITAVMAFGVAVGSGFYLPGVQPFIFMEGEDVPVKVNSLTSTRTQIPLDYYLLPFCQPEGGPMMASENLGEFLTGNKIESSPYKIIMKREAYCNKLCQVELNEIEAETLKIHIEQQYHHNMIIDNLNAAAIGIGAEGEQRKRYSGGFPIGFIDSETEKPYIYNHLNFEIDYHQRYHDGYRVVGFAVEPLSIAHHFEAGYQWDGKSADGLAKPLTTCSSTMHLTRNDIQESQEVRVGEKILFTYDVKWFESEVEWASRWDIYLSEDHLVPARVHWYSITNSILVVLFLSLLVISVLVRNLRRDIVANNAYAAVADEEKEDAEDECGWKLLHADVFRPPSSQPMIFCVFIGTGVQLALTAFFAILLSAAGFLSPARRGSLMMALLAFYILCGVFAGYVSNRMYKSFGGRQWKLCTMLTATLYPGIAFGIFLFFNLALWLIKSSGSAPLMDVLLLLAMWCGVCIPIVFSGACLGCRAGPIEFPTTTSLIARPVPPPATFIMHPTFWMVVAGIFPFIAAYVELFFIMTSLWMDQFYYVFGFTLLVYLIMIIMCAELAVLMVYYQLRAENHRWWWFSFFCSGSIAFFVFGYSIVWFRQLHASNLVMTYLLYFVYMFLICFAMLLVFGTIGSLSALYFVCKIYDCDFTESSTDRLVELTGHYVPLCHDEYASQASNTCAPVVPTDVLAVPTDSNAILGVVDRHESDLQTPITSS